MNKYKRQQELSRARRLTALGILVMIAMLYILSLASCSKKIADKPNQGRTMVDTEDSTNHIKPYFIIDSSLSVDLRARREYTAKVLEEPETKKERRKRRRAERRQNKKSCFLCIMNETHIDGNHNIVSDGKIVDKSDNIENSGAFATIGGKKATDKSNDQIATGSNIDQTNQKDNKGPVADDGSRAKQSKGIPSMVIYSVIFLAILIIVYLVLRKLKILP